MNQGLSDNGGLIRAWYLQPAIELEELGLKHQCDLPVLAWLLVVVEQHLLGQPSHQSLQVQAVVGMEALLGLEGNLLHHSQAGAFLPTEIGNFQEKHTIQKKSNST